MVMAVVAGAGFSLWHATYAATGSLTFSPSSASYNVGDTFTVAVQENSGTDPANTVDAVVKFPSSLQFVSDTTVAPFNFNPASTDTASGGSVTITRAQLGTSSTGAQTVTTITFKVLSAGSAAVSFNAGSDILSANDGSNLLVNSPGATYTLNTPVTPPPPPPPPPPPSPSPTPAPAPGSGSSKGGSVSVTKTGSGSSGSSSGGAAPVNVPNNGSVSTNTPVTVQPATVQTDGVTKVEYYLGGKLVDTETKAPYKYNIDTSKLKNGTYNLVSKTYYDNGSVKQTTQHLVVKNTAEHTSNLTWLYLLIVGIILLLGLGVNFIGPAAGGPFRRLFGGHFGGPSPAGWPTGSVTSGGGGPTHSPASFAAPLNPSEPSLDSRLSHLASPHGPKPGTIFRPHDQS